MQNITIVSWNVNGIRSNIFSSPGEKYTSKGKKLQPFVIDSNSNFSELYTTIKPDIVCLQETRCDDKVFEAIVDTITDLKYKHINCSTNPARGRGSGYSGTAIFTKIEPICITNGLPTLGEPDIEGRCCTAEFEKFYIVNVYTPNSGSNEFYRINEWDPAMLQYLEDLKQTGKYVILVGDMNVCRESIDIFSGYPPESKRVAGLLPEEIAHMQKYTDAGYVDTYRYYNKDEDEGFTWWNPRIKQFREDNKGWRIDYALVSDIKICIESEIASSVTGSDHCPITIRCLI